jgi:hypothetical protein
MSFFSSLDAKDRRLLSWFLSLGLGLAVLTGFVMPSENGNDNPMPSTYLTGQHGAQAAYRTLLLAGYPLERWEHPLDQLADGAGPETVAILARPTMRDPAAAKAVRKILERGGRVLATGPAGASLLPGGAPEASKAVEFAACKLEPEGLDPLAGSGEVWMVPEASWKLGDPAHRVQYSCAGQAAVVEYGWAKGQVVWWASSTPLENGSMARAANLDLLLNSLGPRQGHRFYWDESLHGIVQSEWSLAAGPSLTLLRIGLPLLGLLVVLSFSRRSGPVRDLPPPIRATPIEFIEALGSLYGKAGAASAAVAIAWERFKHRSLRLCGLSRARAGDSLSATELAVALRRRFPQADPALEADLTACEEAAWGESVSAREALRLVQALHRHGESLSSAIGLSGSAAPATTHPHLQERAL